jgi:hypothetical protein
LTDLEKAKMLLADGGHGDCVLCRGDTVHASKAKGISPMIDFISAGFDLRDFSAADKIVGKAAGLLFVHAGVKTVYAKILSRSAQIIFKNYGIDYTFGTLADFIKNRAGDGLCIMEQAVADVNEPSKAFIILKNTLDSLRKKVTDQR